MGPGAGRDVFAVPGDRRPPEPGAQRPDPAGRGQADPGRLGRGGGICGLYPDKLHPKTPLAPGAARLAGGAGESAPAPPQQKEPTPARLVVDLGKDPEALTDDQAALLRALRPGGNSPPTTWWRPRAFPPGGCSPPSPCSRSASGWRRQGGGSHPGGAERRTYPSPRG